MKKNEKLIKRNKNLALVQFARPIKIWYLCTIGEILHKFMQNPGEA